jgi:hypothetical protein
MDAKGVEHGAAARADPNVVPKKMDAQREYDRFMREVVVPNERWEVFVDHDLQRLRRIRDEGGDAGIEAAELRKFFHSPLSLYLSPP